MGKEGKRHLRGNLYLNSCRDVKSDVLLSSGKIMSHLQTNTKCKCTKCTKCTNSAQNVITPKKFVL